LHNIGNRNRSFPTQLPTWIKSMHSTASCGFCAVPQEQKDHCRLSQVRSPTGEIP